MKKSTKDFIKVNAYVALFFASMSVFQSLTILMDPTVLKDAISQLSAIQKQDKGMSQYDLSSLMQQMIWVILFYGVALVTHVLISFKLLKTYSGIFSIAKEDTVG